MSNEETILFVIFFSIAFILIYKYIRLYLKKKHMIKINATVTDVIKRTTYQKNMYVYFYKYKFKGEEYSTSDNTRYKILGFNPKINDTYEIFINTKKPSECITPLDLFLSKISLILSIVLIIVPFIL